MDISPRKIDGELESSYHLRMLIFCSFCLVFFSVLLVLMLAYRPEPSNSDSPIMIMFLWLGVSISFGASALATLGYLIGTLFHLLIERYKLANFLWPRVKIILGIIFITLIISFFLYWFVYGLIYQEVLPFAKHSSTKLINSSDNTLFFWFSIFMWGALGTCAPIALLIGSLNNLTRHSRGAPQKRYKRGQF